MLVSDVPKLAAHNAPADRSIHFEGQAITYRTFADRCRQLSRALTVLAPRGARITVLSGNRPEFMECYFGVPGAGMIMLPLNFRLGLRDLGHILRDAEPAVVMVEPAYLPLIEQLRGDLPENARVVVFGTAPGHDLDYEGLLERGHAGEVLQRPGEDEPAWLLYTSGTTGRAKGALLTHRNIMAAVLNMLCGSDLGRQEVSLFMFPMFHIAGYVLPGYLLRGYTIVLMRGFDVETYLANVEKYAITQHAIAPTMLAMVLDDPRTDRFDMSSLRNISYGASAMAPEILRAAMARWPNVGFRTAYGMTELAGNVTYLTREHHDYALAHDQSVLASCGEPNPLSNVRIVDAEGRDVVPGEAGEIIVRGEQVFAGYWRNEQATQESFRGGWFLTGDIGRFDQAGRLYIVDRKKDMIISGGENVYSREVEDLLYEHPSVAEVAIVGAPDSKWGETVVALVRLRSAATAAALDEFCKAHIGGYKRPRRYIFVEELPKSATGKILKAELRQLLRSGHFDPKETS
jgi:acyl-CoA synthetase (AMP-forming)/AMP-acid ligase II